MFDAFGPTPAEKGRRRRMFASTGVAALVYAGIGATVLVLAGPVQTFVADEDSIDVSFEHVLKKDTPPPPPPSPAEEAPKPKAKPRAALTAPTAVPLEKPEESDAANLVPAPPAEDPAAEPEAAPAVEDKPQDVKEAAPPPQPPKVRPKRSEPVNLPEDAEPPEPEDGNPVPAYPESARAAGVEGKVILKIAISESGAVVDIKVMRGDPLLAEAAIAAVQRWRFKPAMLDGKPIAVFRIVPLNFTSTVGG